MQKGSPYEKDVNRLIDMANQMGLIEELLNRETQNVSVCKTWNDVKASHLSKNTNVVFYLEDVGGVMIMLVIGLTLSLLAFIAENMTHWWNTHNVA